MYFLFYQNYANRKLLVWTKHRLSYCAYAPDLIAESLCLIFNRSLITDIFPDEWKCSQVIPLFKKGDRRLLDNYRPISVIPVVAKVFERIVV